ncbi:hypothetical protein Tco_0084628 [Tanacetum coccineum]
MLGTSASTTRPQDTALDAIRRPCCKEIDDMVYSEKDVRASILIPRQRTFVQELKLENHPEATYQGSS